MNCQICGDDEAVTQAPGGANCCHSCGLLIHGYLQLRDAVGITAAIRAFTQTEIETRDELDLPENEET